MTWMNEYEIRQAADWFEDHPLLGPATQTLVNLMDWTNGHSDGWPYWRKPSQAAQKLQKLIQLHQGEVHNGGEVEVELAKVIAAYRPIKAFLTRQGVSVDEKRQIVVDLPVVS